MTNERRTLNRRTEGTPVFDRKAISQGVKGAQEESYKTRDSSGKWISIFKDQTPPLQFWNCTDGPHVIDIIPFRVGPNNPNKKQQGDFTYILDLYIHRNIGVEEGTYLCMSKTYGEPCSICDYIKEIKREVGFDEKFIKEIRPVRRAIYNIVEITSDATEAKGIQIWDVAHFYIEAELTVLAQDPRSAGGAIPYADPDVGKSFSFVKSTIKGQPPSYKGLKFMDRPKPISDAILMQAKGLDELIILPKFQELRDTLEKGTAPPKTIDDDIPGLRGQPPATVRNADATLTAPTSTEICPSGHKFGDDCELFPECVKCSKYNSCADLYDKLTNK